MKIAIPGCSGAGKPTLARKLGERAIRQHHRAIRARYGDKGTVLPGQREMDRFLDTLWE